MKQRAAAFSAIALRPVLRLLVLAGAGLVWWLLLSGGAAQASDTGHDHAATPSPLASTVRDTTTSVTDRVGSATAAVTHAVRHTTASAPDPVRSASDATATTMDTVVGNSAITITEAVAQTTGVVDVVTAPVAGTTQHPSVDRSPRVARERVSPARHANSLHRVAPRVFRAAIADGAQAPRLRPSGAELAPAPGSPAEPGVPTSPAAPVAPTMSAAGPVADLAGLALALPLVIRRSRLRHADVMPAGPTFGPDSSPD